MKTWEQASEIIYLDIPNVEFRGSEENESTDVLRIYYSINGEDVCFTITQISGITNLRKYLQNLVVQYQGGFLCTHQDNWDDCPDCRH